MNIDTAIGIVITAACVVLDKDLLVSFF
ncbi:hypothetical protein JL09_g6494 [Pichia kudriavzevii]|uniref:Uncharacterized protein n=1 Tax=Pichia kudriavzevii TaxID=4909 RepID=A0A099NQN4_PICKU|nr:hypothetical protein JL09_g6494 [Pichia kudriavzevii]